MARNRFWHDTAYALGGTVGGRQAKQFVTFLDPNKAY
jgi:hypothetical protein